LRICIGDAPVATLRGWFVTSSEVDSLRFRTDWQDRFPRAQVPKAGNIWLAFRWDSYKPMSELARSSSTQEQTFWEKLSMPVVWGVTLPGPPAISIGGRQRERNDGARASLYLRNLIKESIAALVFLHDRGRLN
jgi:hypothetical protein